MIELRIFLGDELDQTADLLPNRAVVIGRSPHADLRLLDLQASRRHVRVQLTAAGLSVEDLGSSAGTKLNGVPMTANEPVLVPLPCVIVIGRHRLEIGWAGESSSATIWGDYTKGALLGEGGFGQVFAATRRSDGQPVAIKELAIYDPVILERFRREARLCETLEHTNLVRTLEVREEDEGLYQIMELIEGGNDLKDHLAARGTLSVSEVLDVAEAVAKGLQAIHEAGLVHRDIKPANVMRTPTGELKITDFGLARAQETGHTLTKTNAGIGTLSYMSPEQALDAKRAGPRSDLYSLGATLYQALTGQLPFPQDRVEDLLDAITEGVSTPIQELRPDCPPALAKLIHRLLSRDPDGRYASAKLLIKRLAKVREGLA